MTFSLGVVFGNVIILFAVEMLNKAMVIEYEIVHININNNNNNNNENNNNTMTIMMMNIAVKLS